MSHPENNPVGPRLFSYSYWYANLSELKNDFPSEVVYTTLYPVFEQNVIGVADIAGGQKTSNKFAARVRTMATGSSGAGFRTMPVARKRGRHYIL